MHKRFSEEFKKSAVIRVQNGESQLSVASSLGISYKTLNRWVIQAKGQMPPEDFPGHDFARLQAGQSVSFTSMCRMLSSLGLRLKVEKAADPED